MVKFLKCETTSCHEDGAEERQDALVDTLNNKFGHMACSCHPDYTWIVAVDLNKNCKFSFHHSYAHVDGTEPNCGFRERLIKNEVHSFMETLE